MLPSPTPMPNARAYERELELRLAFDEECARNYRAFLKSDRRAIKPDYSPIKLDIENVSRCNFRCVMCQVSEWPKGQRADDMTLEHFRAIIDSNPGLVEIKIQGMGEPTLGRDDFFEMIRYARNRHIWVRSVTNGSLLHQNRNIEKYYESGINELQVSIDGATKEVFEGIRRNSHFDRVMSNCAALNKYGASAGKRIAKMWTVVQQANIHQLEDLVQLAADLEFSSAVFSLDVIDWGKSDWSGRAAELQLDEFNEERGEALVARGRTLGIDVSFWRIEHKYDASEKETLCPWPFERSFVSSDGRVVPCCMIADPDTYEIGRLEGSTDLESVWRSPQYVNFRLAHVEGNIPRICKGCYTHAEEA